MQDPRSVERLRNGDVASLKRLFKANHAKLYPLAYRLTKNRDAAGLVIRQAFQRLWEGRDDLDVFEPLDLRLVHDTYVEAMAYRKDNGVTGFAIDPERVKSNGSLSEIEGIDADDSLNYMLYVVDGYSFRELARAHESSVEDVQLSVGRALTALREKQESSFN
jgi:DNA-directed RNA polymerase specialized sigma24 family protein